MLGTHRPLASLEANVSIGIAVGKHCIDASNRLRPPHACNAALALTAPRSISGSARCRPGQHLGRTVPPPLKALFLSDINPPAG
eukprot:365614-Chlamydomonas_euryale.AAC.5